MSHSNQPPSLDWGKIADQYPEATAEWYLYFNNMETSLDIERSYSNATFNSLVGHLLAFFDERGLCVNDQRHHHLWYASVEVVSKGHYWLDLDDEGYTKHYDSRPQALAAAFTQAFRMLEGKLEEGGDA